MPVQHSLWRVGATPYPLAPGIIGSESELEEMIVAAPAILSDEWMIVGRQEDTGHGGRIDLLALAPDGAPILIELKRDRTPRDVVAQALDYASWAERLTLEDVARMYAAFSGGGDLIQDFTARTGTELEELRADAHQVVIVGARLDPASERIVSYLNRRGVAINVLFFQVFDHGDEQFLSRAWLIDPVEAQVAASRGSARSPAGEWNGEYYVNYDHSSERDWAEAVRYGFVCAGGGPWYVGTLNLLSEGDRIWVNAPRIGYVGVGRVVGEPTALADFRLPDAQGAAKPASDILTGGTYHRHFIDDPQRTEIFVPVKWQHTRPIEQAVSETGLFGNQNTVCAPKTAKWPHTVARLSEAFGVAR